MPPPKAQLYLIVIRHFMAINTTFHPLSFSATNIGHTKPHGLGYGNGYTGLHALILAPGALHVPNHVPTLDQSTVSPFH